jgi:hypothetical protein
MLDRLIDNQEHPDIHLDIPSQAVTREIKLAENKKSNPVIFKVTSFGVGSLLIAVNRVPPAALCNTNF